MMRFGGPTREGRNPADGGMSTRAWGKGHSPGVRSELRERFAEDGGRDDPWVREESNL